MKDGSITLGSKHWHYASHKWEEYGKPSGSKDFNRSISHEHFSSSPTSLMISRLQVTEVERNANWHQNRANPSIPKGSDLVLKVKIRTENVPGDGVSIYMYGLFDNDKAENYFLSNEGRQRGVTKGVVYFDDVSLCVE